jgi:methylphosphotriester-DNA--protein-cysteine methyltransferase
MKRLAVIAAFAVSMGAGSLLQAQATDAAAVHPHPRLKEVHARIHEQAVRIKAGVKTGKLTKEQAHALLVSLKAVRAQIKADFTANGKKMLTQDQLAQINQMLDDNSKSIYGEKHDDGASAPSGNDATGSSSDNSAPPASNP